MQYQTVHVLRRSVILLLVVGLTTFGFSLLGGPTAVEAGSGDRSIAPAPELLQAEGIELVEGTEKVNGEFVSNDGVVSWRVVSYQSSVGTCVNAQASAATGGGSVGGCDPSLESPGVAHMLGGMVRIGDQPYSVAYGGADPGVARIRLTLADGDKVDVSVSDGWWLYSAPTGGGEEPWVERVEGLSSTGAVLVAATAEVAPAGVGGQPGLEEADHDH